MAASPFPMKLSRSLFPLAAKADNSTPVRRKAADTASHPSGGGSLLGAINSNHDEKLAFDEARTATAERSADVVNDRGIRTEKTDIATRIPLEPPGGPAEKFPALPKCSGRCRTFGRAI